MITKIDKNAVRQRRHARVRKTLSGTAQTPRMSVYRSTTNIYVQLIDDVNGVTLASASTLEKAVKEQVAGKTKTEAAKIVGATLGERAKEKGIETVVFDRGGYLYTGRVQALADGAREAGLKF
ncbi:MAG: 50S ribosomal protein L18 [Candidatus Gallimonas sp.]